MRFSVGLRNHGMERQNDSITPESVTSVARAAEEAGFYAVSVVDHPMPDDDWMRHGGHRHPDPFVALTLVAAVTTRLRLLTHALVVPYRNPFLTAKAAATLDALSNGRLILGVAAGYLEPEFAALGVDFSERNELFDEAVRTVKAAWAGESVHLEGRHFVARGHTLFPRPAQRPHPPIWVAGNSRLAIRRAVEQGDGWMPLINPNPPLHPQRTPQIASVQVLRERLGYLRQHAAIVGRVQPVEVVVPLGAAKFGTPAFSRDELLEQAATLREAGATCFVCSLPGETSGELAENVRAFGEDVLSRA